MSFAVIASSSPATSVKRCLLVRSDCPGTRLASDVDAHRQSLSRLPEHHLRPPSPQPLAPALSNDRRSNARLPHHDVSAPAVVVSERTRVVKLERPSQDERSVRDRVQQLEMRLTEKPQQRTVEGLLQKVRECAEDRLVCERRVQQLEERLRDQEQLHVTSSQAHDKVHARQKELDTVWSDTKKSLYGEMSEAHAACDQVGQSYNDLSGVVQALSGDVGRLVVRCEQHEEENIAKERRAQILEARLTEEAQKHADHSQAHVDSHQRQRELSGDIENLAEQCAQQREGMLVWESRAETLEARLAKESQKHNDHSRVHAEAHQRHAELTESWSEATNSLACEIAQVEAHVFREEAQQQTLALALEGEVSKLTKQWEDDRAMWASRLQQLEGQLVEETRQRTQAQESMLAREKILSDSCHRANDALAVETRKVESLTRLVSELTQGVEARADEFDRRLTMTTKGLRTDIGQLDERLKRSVTELHGRLSLKEQEHTEHMKEELTSTSSFLDSTHETVMAQFQRVQQIDQRLAEAHRQRESVRSSTEQLAERWERQRNDDRAALERRMQELERKLEKTQQREERSCASERPEEARSTTPGRTEAVASVVQPTDLLSRQDQIMMAMRMQQLCSNPSSTRVEVPRKESTSEQCAGLSVSKLRGSSSNESWNPLEQTVLTPM